MARYKDKIITSVELQHLFCNVRERLSICSLPVILRGRVWTRYNTRNIHDTYIYILLLLYIYIYNNDIRYINIQCIYVYNI